MAEFSLEEGLTLPPKDKVDVLPDASADEYAKIIASSKAPVSKQTTSSLIEKERALIKEGQILERREVNRISGVVRKQQALQESTAAAFDEAANGVEILNRFQEQNEAIKQLNTPQINIR